MTQTTFNGYAELSLAKQSARKSKSICEKTQAEKEFLAILEKNLFLEQSHEDWGSGVEAKPFTLDDLEVEFADYAGIKEEETTHLSSLDPLSKVLSTSPTSFKSNRISAVNRQVYKIDKLPEKCKTTLVLLLSNNYIKDLSGLQQFENLKTLSLSNNVISTFRSLNTVSKACESLENVNLEGNQICKYPFYRSHIISCFPKLHVLDNCPVSDKERKVAKRDVLVTAEQLSEIVQNYCLICFLRHVVDLLNIHVGIRSKLEEEQQQQQQQGCLATAMVGGTSLPVTRASIRTLISSWKKENHFGEEILEDIKLHYSLELSKVKHQLQYFCKKAGIKQDKSNLWMKAFGKVLVHQETLIKELSTQIEQFTPLDVRVTGTLLPAWRAKTGGGGQSKDPEPEPVARLLAPKTPIAGQAAKKLCESDGLQHRQRTRLRFRPIERKSPDRESEDRDLDEAQTTTGCGRTTTEHASVSGAGDADTDTDAEAHSLVPSLVRTFENQFTSATTASNTSEIKECARTEQVTQSHRSEARRAPESQESEGKGTTTTTGPVVGSGKRTSLDSPLFKNLVVEEELKMGSEGRDLSMVEELRLTIEHLDEEATTVVESVDRAIEDLHLDIDNIIVAQQSLQQKVVHTKLSENETKCLLKLEKKQNEKLRESTGAIDKLIQENNNLKLDVASLNQEYQDILGQLRREKQKSESLERELQVRQGEEETRQRERREEQEERQRRQKEEEDERQRRRKEEEEESKRENDLARARESLARRSLLRRVLLHYAHRVQTLQWQKEALLDLQRTSQKRIKREVLLWWSAVHEYLVRVKHFKMERKVRQAVYILKYWTQWACLHRKKRLLMLDLYERADNISKRKVLLHWREIALAMLESQAKIAYTFQQFWIRKKAFAAFCATVQEKREEIHSAVLADRHRTRRVFHSWCRVHVEEVDLKERMDEAEAFHRKLVLKRTFNRFLLLVVLNERRHIAKLIANNHYVTRLQFNAVKGWKEAVSYSHKKEEALGFSQHRYLHLSFGVWRQFWSVQVSKRARRKKMGVIGKIITNERNAQIRSSYFFKWYAYAKKVSAETLEDQLIEQQEQEQELEQELEHHRAETRRQQRHMQKRRDSTSKQPKDDGPGTSRRRSYYTVGADNMDLEMDVEASNEDEVLFENASQGPPPAPAPAPAPATMARTTTPTQSASQRFSHRGEALFNRRESSNFIPVAENFGGYQQQQQQQQRRRSVRAKSFVGGIDPYDPFQNTTPAQKVPVFPTQIQSRPAVLTPRIQENMNNGSEDVLVSANRSRRTSLQQPQPKQQAHVRELVDLHNEISQLQSRILNTLES